MIVIIEDDNSIRELVCYTLNNTGFDAIGFEDGSGFFEFANQTIPTLLLLDIMLPKEDGISILKKIRSDKRLSNIPIVMISAKDSEYDKVVGLDQGADDYLTKPFGMMELIARVKAVLRRVCDEETDSEQCFTYKGLTVNNSTHTVIVNGQTVDLALKEYQILMLLLQNQGYVLNRDVLLQKIWGYDFDGETRTVDVHIRMIRSKIGECGNYIETVRGVGYKIGGN